MKLYLLVDEYIKNKYKQQIVTVKDFESNQKKLMNYFINAQNKQKRMNCSNLNNYVKK
jgi:hypothetical protein